MGDSFNRNPTTFSDLNSNKVLQAIRVRYELINHIYSEYRRINREGGTLIRPSFYKYPNDYTIAWYNRTYFLTDTLYVAPNVSGSASYSVYFPPDTFYDYYNGQIVRGQQVNYTVSKVLNTPIYIRSGVVIGTITNSNKITSTEGLKNAATSNMLIKIAHDHYSYANGNITAWNQESKSWLDVKVEKRGPIIKFFPYTAIDKTNTSPNLQVQKIQVYGYSNVSLNT